MRSLELNQRVGNLKTDKVGKIASTGFRVNSGDFNGFVILTDRYGYEVWDSAVIVILPSDFLAVDPVPDAKDSKEAFETMMDTNELR
jgi:hypothetical protein